MQKRKVRDERKRFPSRTVDLDKKFYLMFKSMFFNFLEVDR